MLRLLKLLDALEDSDEVQNVWANFDIPDAVLQKLSACCGAAVSARPAPGAFYVDGICTERPSTRAASARRRSSVTRVRPSRRQIAACSASGARSISSKWRT